MKAHVVWIHPQVSLVNTIVKMDFGDRERSWSGYPSLTCLSHKELCCTYDSATWNHKDVQVPVKKHFKKIKSLSGRSPLQWWLRRNMFEKRTMEKNYLEVFVQTYEFVYFFFVFSVDILLQEQLHFFSTVFCGCWGSCAQRMFQFKDWGILGLNMSIERWRCRRPSEWWLPDNKFMKLAFAPSIMAKKRMCLKSGR